MDFLPAPSGWEERSPYIGRYGAINVRHMEFALQALAKLERGTGQDLADADAMRNRGLITRDQMRSALEHMRTALFRYPAIDAPSFIARAETFIQQMS